jgi:hypothetical protein
MQEFPLHITYTTFQGNSKKVWKSERREVTSRVWLRTSHRNCRGSRLDVMCPSWSHGSITISRCSKVGILIVSCLFRFSIHTITYRVFHHDLLITKLHHIDYKIVLMAYIVQKIGFMASRKSSYLNKRWGWSNDEPPCQKAPSLSPPCHAKVTLLMAEFCDPTSASDKPLFAFMKTFVDRTCPKQHACRRLNYVREMSRWARKPQTVLWLWYKYSQPMRNIYYWYEKKNGKDWFTPHISVSEICDLPLIM